MTGQTHRAMNVALTTTVAVAASVPTLSAVAAVGVAYVVSRAPDKLEVLGFDHREQTHWPLVGIMLAIGAGVLTDLATRGQVLPVALPSAVFLGVLCGYVGHVLADALTRGGAPLLGPASTRDMWLLPKRARIAVHATVKDGRGNVISRRPSAGDLAYRYGALVVTVLVIFASQKGGIS